MSISLSYIELTAINKRYKKATKNSLNKISFKINAGDKLGVLGPNGAGKTTLISILCGLLEPTFGDVIYKSKQGDNIVETDLKKIIGFVPQEYAFYHELTPTQNLAYFGALYNISSKEIKKRSEKLLSILGILDVAHKKVSTFSGGMKRKVNLAIGLIHQPEILFLDEPTVGVDVQSKVAIIDFLNEINAAGTTIIYSSHHLSEAEDFCNSILMLNNGNIIAEGETKALINSNNANNLHELFINLSKK